MTELKAQSIIYKSASKDLQKKYTKAVQLYQQNKYDVAKESFQKIIIKKPNFVDPYIMLGSIHFDQGQYSNAENYFQKAIHLDSHYQIKIYYTIALCQYKNYRFGEAYRNLKYYLSKEQLNQDLLSKAQLLIPNYRFADSAYRNPLEIKLEPIQAINTELSEYLPSITADGKTLVFTRKVSIRNEDLFISYKNELGNWSEPKPIEEINSFYNEGAPAISPDGNTLIFTSCDRPESLGGCDLFISYLKEGSWSRPANLGHQVNTSAYESQPCISDNGNLLIFTSNRQGTLGGMDLWESRFMVDKGWSKPKNLGKKINTSAHESCPFIHPNGNTLFFGSTGHPGMGENDIFYSERFQREQWTTPLNMGFPINTTLDESSFITDFTGTTAYIASDRKENLLEGTKQNLDFYSFSIPKDLRPKASEYLELIVKNGVTNVGMMADVSIYNLTTSQIFYKNVSDPSGRLLVSLPVREKFAIHVSQIEFITHFEHINTSENPGSYLNPRKLIVSLYPVQKINTTVILKNVFFEFSSDELKPESHYELNLLADWLSKNEKIRIKITGHTDNIGEDSFNLDLSLSRASAVRNYLLTKGIQESRLIVEGKGAKVPIRSNETAEGRQQNRRTEFEIIH